MNSRHMSYCLLVRCSSQDLCIHYVCRALHIDLPTIISWPQLRSAILFNTTSLTTTYSVNEPLQPPLLTVSSTEKTKQTVQSISVSSLHIITLIELAVPDRSNGITRRTWFNSHVCGRQGASLPDWRGTFARRTHLNPNVGVVAVVIVNNPFPLTLGQPFSEDCDCAC